MPEIVKRQHALFLGHGSPMNILADNLFTQDLKNLRDCISEPEAILVISAHWLTRGTHLTASARPQQIYDFYGFPDNLYKYKYNAPGSPEIAKIITETIGNNLILPDPDRGIDHAAWSVLKHIYPEQKIPVLELSLDIEKDPDYHYRLGQKLAVLREKNILIIGSGNVIHNLSDIDSDEKAPHFEWAEVFDSQIKSALLNREYDRLINYRDLGSLSRRAIPYADHYLPMLYILGMTGEDENVIFVHESVQNGSISMRSFITG